MKTFSHLLICMLLSLTLVNCSSDKEADGIENASITVKSPTGEHLFSTQANDRLTVSFYSTHEWRATVDVDWVVVSPSKGMAGENTLSVLTKENNDTGMERSGVLTISCGNAHATISFKQSTNEVLQVGQTDYSVPAEGGDITLTFATNCDGGRIVLAASEAIDWIVPKQAEDTRALVTGEFELTILPNDVRYSRTASFVIQVLDASNPDVVLIESPTITVRQASAAVGTSTDYSQDKKIFELQRHSIGTGIPLIFMGDGFLDKDIANGFYRQAMETAMEHFFTEEPVKGLRDYFDVWMVNAVSTNDSFDDIYSTKFDCRLEGGNSTLIEGNLETVMEYAELVPALKDNNKLFAEATCIVVLNTEEYAGTCYFGFSNQSGTEIYNLAIGFCPMINGMNDEMFRRVLCHECIGHGFAKLLDEYSYQQMGHIPDEEIESNQKMQQIGWAANVDFTSSPELVLWKNFLKDPRYQVADNYGEKLGVYEGACTYWTGAYRPTNESMMRSNMNGFNVPSREAIFKRVMGTGLGSPWVYDYEEFVQFDQAHLPVPVYETTRTLQEEVYKPFASPVFTNMHINLD